MTQTRKRFVRAKDQPRPNVLIVGGGGREHALAQKLARSPQRPVLHCAPGNPGIASLARCHNISAENVDALVELATAHAFDLVVIGPEATLAAGLTDRLIRLGIPVLGPTAEAAAIETSKWFAKELMQQIGVPTARAQVFDVLEDAVAFIATTNGKVVVKADGLAAGKGVTVCSTTVEAMDAASAMFGGRFGMAGQRILVEERLDGEELSLMTFVSDRIVVPMIPARDHKRLGDGDAGPNTGGMGAYAPVPGIDGDLVDDIVSRIVQPVVDELWRRGIRYRGVLYAGLMMTENGPTVIEFNARFGDPETQVVLPLMESDLLTVLQAVADGRLAEKEVFWNSKAAACVVVADPGYPNNVESNIPIRSLPFGTQNQYVLQAGTGHSRSNVFVTKGGRVACSCAVASSVELASLLATELAEYVDFEGAHYRRDIGQAAPTTVLNVV